MIVSDIKTDAARLRTLTGEGPLVALCVGSEKINGDCLGPMVGQMLKESDFPHYIYGTLSRPVSASNVEQTADFIARAHPYSKVIAIDAAIGEISDRGKIFIKGGGLYPAAASGRHIKRIGDVAVTAVMTDAKPDERRFSLVSPAFVYMTARRITEILRYALSPYPCHNYTSNGLYPHYEKIKI